MGDAVSWWLDRSDGALLQVGIVEGTPRLVVVWVSSTIVEFYTLDNGAFHGALELVAPAVIDPAAQAWRNYAGRLCEPSGMPLAAAQMGAGSVLVSYDGRFRLYWDHAQGLLLDSDGAQMALPHHHDTPLVAVGLDRELGTIGLVTQSGMVEFYQQHVYVGGYEVAGPDDGAPVAIALPDAAGVAIVFFERSVAIVDLSGRVRHKAALSFSLGSGVCAPAGEVLAASERLTPIVRIYDGELAAVAQGDVRDVIGSTQALHLMPRDPRPGTTVDAMALADDGTFVFAIDGVVCCAHTMDLPELPHSRTLF